MPSTELKSILYIEDDEGLSRLLQKRLARRNYIIQPAYTGQDGLNFLENQHFDLVLLDYNLPDMSGLDIIRHLKDVKNAPPVILLTVSGDERIAVEAMQMGAADYAIKDPNQFYIDLLPAIMGAAYTRDRLMKVNTQQREELERAIERAETANRAKGEFLATMSHEIRTPMNAVIGLSNLLSKTPLNLQQKEMVHMLQTNADLLLKLINDLLDLSRIESGQIELENLPFKPADLLTNLETLFFEQAQNKNLSLTLNNKVSEAAFMGDQSRIQQILINLVSNAIKFTHEGQIRIITYVEEKKNAPNIFNVVFSVQDTGIGIPEDKIDAIFEKFVQADQSITRRFGGTGLGLAISKNLAEILGGVLYVKSTLGEGTEFSLHLPLEKSPDCLVDCCVPDEQEEDSHDNKGKVLLVEDYPANIMVASMMLEELGFRVDVAHNGFEAVVKMKQATKPYYAVLMDVQMEGMDGFETTRRLRTIEAEKGFKHHIIGVTAHALTGDREKCLDAGMNDYMSKPINPTILSHKMENAGAILNPIM